mmetsp:Transcript_17978/g.53248  ORF Transcript_17978/g.53248 Transcript_17978/m.53248 type:complete len:836 (-) Transcript_17978:78-2585(-)
MPHTAEGGLAAAEVAAATTVDEPEPESPPETPTEHDREGAPTVGPAERDATAIAGDAERADGRPLDCDGTEDSDGDGDGSGSSGATSWMARTFFAEPLRLVTNVAKAGIRKTGDAVRVMTGEEDFHLGSTIRCAASWVTGDKRPYPKLPTDGPDSHRKKVAFLKDVRLSALSYPGTSCRPVAGDISLTDRYFVFTPRAAAAVFPPGEHANISHAADDDGAAPASADADVDGGGTRHAPLDDATIDRDGDLLVAAAAAATTTVSDEGRSSDSSPDEQPGPTEAAVTEPYSFQYSMIRDVNMPMQIQLAEVVHLKVILKTFQVVSLEVPGDSALPLFQTLVGMAFVPELKLLPAFDAAAVVDEGLAMEETAGAAPAPFAEPVPQWDLLDVQAEYERMGFGDKWRLFSGNEHYELCPTYPSHLYVPARVDDEAVRQSAAFRSKGRFPALSYFYAKTGAALLRSAQPLSGLSAKRNKHDENLVVTALDKAESPDAMYHILDARPKLNAIANRANGKGYENFSNYGERCVGCFLHVENIHVMRASIEAVVAACSMTEAVLAWEKEPSSTTAAPFVSAIKRSEWLYHIRQLLKGAASIAHIMGTRGESALVHCSDGWDRTAQLSTLAQIMLDPHSRTIAGLCALLHKEWLAFGHKFEDRLGTLHLPRREVSPVFTQCLDCIWQLMQQNPMAFEFAPSFLVALHQAVHSSAYGTFLCNSEKARLVDHKLHTRTRCLWRKMAKIAHLHTNGQYEPTSDVLVIATEEEDTHASRGFFSALYIPRGLPQDTLHNPIRAAVVTAHGGDPEWPQIVTVAPTPEKRTPVRAGDRPVTAQDMMPTDHNV